MKLSNTIPIVTLASISDKIDYGLTTSAQNIDGKPKFLRITDIQNNSVDWNSVPSCECTEKDYRKYALNKGDIVFARTGATTGKSFLIRDCPQAVFASYLIRVSPSSKINPEYLSWFFQTSNYWRQITFSSTGTAQPGVNSTKLKELKIPLPPLEEQKRIAAILDKADRVRRKRQEAIRLTEELGRSIFLDMFGDPVTNPKGWKIKKLRSVIQSIDAGWSANGEEKKCEEDEWGVLKVSAVTSGKFKPFEHKSVGRNPNFSKSPIIPKKGDLLFSRANTRELVAATCIVEQDYERIFLSDKLWRISVLENLITPEYLKFLLTYQRYRDLLTKQATGTSGSMLNISQGKLLDMNAPIPDIEAQRKFSDLIWQSIQVSTRIQENSKESENLFNSLLQRAFRGEL